MISLLEVIKSYMNEAEISDAQLMRFKEIAQRGIMDLHMKVSGLPVTVKLENFNPDLLVCPLPKDYLNVVTLGYLSSGVIVPFFQNPRIKLYTDDGSCHSQNTSASAPPMNVSNLFNSSYGYYWGPYNRTGPNGITGGFSNLGGAASYYVDFDIDELNGFIQFGQNPRIDIYMKYLANPKKIGNEYMVHPFDVQALIAWIGWRDIINKPKVSQVTVREKMSEYYRERGEARKAHYGYSMDFAIQMVRQTNKATTQF